MGTQQVREANVGGRTRGSARRIQARRRQLGALLGVVGIGAILISGAGLTGAKAASAAEGSTSSSEPTLVTYGPGQASSWHAHRGVHEVKVLSGTITILDSNCVRHSYSEGETYAGGRDVHLAKNETATPVRMAVNYLVDAGTTWGEFVVPVHAPPDCAAGVMGG